MQLNSPFGGGAGGGPVIIYIFTTMQKQTTHQVLMIRPTNFGFNEEAFLSNSFQNKPTEKEEGSIQSLALQEFDAFVDQLKSVGVDVIEFEDVPNSQSPDSIFPNNWISTHENGLLFTYPMTVSNRRKERRQDIIDFLIAQNGYRSIDLSLSENHQPPQFLEGTGSMIFDHHAKRIYAAISPRTDEMLLHLFAKQLGYSVVSFTAYGKAQEKIYHTNVMLCIGDTFAVLGADTIDEQHRKMVIESLENDGKEIIYLSNDQVYNHFAGNMLQLQNTNGEHVLVMSDSAFNALTEEQLGLIKKHNEHILHVSIPTIERIGGGSARCMIAEVFSPL